MPRLVYLVDDDPSEITLSTARLEGADFVTRGFSNPRQALEALVSDPPDAVITDLTMPEMSGIELIHAIREHYPTLPVIVVTGMGGDVAIEALNAGAADFVSKPVERGDLVARLRRVLQEQPAQEILLETERKLFDGLVGSQRSAPASRSQTFSATRRNESATSRKSCGALAFHGAPDRIRTCDLRLQRRPYRF